jgi:hypothetical protein
VPAAVDWQHEVLYVISFVSRDVMAIKRVKLVVCYAGSDELLCHELESHLAHMKNAGLVEPWHIGYVQGGGDWRSELVAHIDQADLVVLLISADFLATEECYELALKRSLARQANGQAKVVPVLVRSVDCDDALAAGLSVLPENGKAVTLWEDRDQAWTTVARSIRILAEALQQSEVTPAYLGPRTYLRRLRTMRRPLLSLAGAMLLAALTTTAMLVHRDGARRQARQAQAEQILRDHSLVEQRLSQLQTMLESFAKDAPSHPVALSTAQANFARALDEQYRQFQQHAWWWYGPLPGKARQLGLSPSEQQQVADSVAAYQKNLVESTQALDPLWGTLLLPVMRPQARSTLATVDAMRRTLASLAQQRATIAHQLGSAFSLPPP